MQTNKIEPLWIYNCNPDHKYSKKQEVNSAAISNDGRLIVAGTFYHDYAKDAKRDLTDSRFFIYCFESEQSDPLNPSPRFQWEVKNMEGVYWVDIAGNGQMVAAGGANFVVAYKTSDGSQLLSASTNSRVNQLVLSQDGSWLAVASDRLYLFHYDGANYELSDTFPTPQVVYSVSMSADGRHIAMSVTKPLDGSSGGQVFLLRNDGGSIIEGNVFTLPDSFARSVHMNPRGTWFASGGASSESEPGCVYFFDCADFRKTARPKWAYPVSGIVYNVFVDDDGHIAAVYNNGPDAGYLTLFNRAGQLVWNKPVRRNPNSTSIAGGYITVATGHPNNTPSHFYLLNLGTGETIWRYDVQADMSWPMFLSLDGTRIVAGSDNQQIFCFKP